MKTRIPSLIATGALALMAACNPGDEADPTEDLDVGYDVGGENQQVDIPDSLAFAMADQDADSVIDPAEFGQWLEAQNAFAEGPEPAWRDDLDLRVEELEWQSSAQYLYTRNREPGQFEEWDTSGDLELSPQEVLVALEQQGVDELAEPVVVETREDLADVLFRLWDIDGNGELSRSEYGAGIAIWWL